MHFAGGSVRVPLGDGEIYAGIGVCSHDKNSDRAGYIFTNVEIKNVSALRLSPCLYSSLETVTIDTTIRHAIYLAPNRFEAPNWSRDGSYFIFNRNGHLEKLPVAGGEPKSSTLVSPTK